MGGLTSILVAPAAFAQDCVETVSRVPMVGTIAGARSPAPQMSRVGDVVRPAGPSAQKRATVQKAAQAKPARVAKVRKAVRKAPRPKAVAHKAAKPVKRRIVRRAAAPVQVAALAPPKGYPDARLMMTRLAPPAATPQFALIRTTACTTGIAPGGRLMPLLGSPGDGLVPSESFLPGDGGVFVPPPFGPPFGEEGPILVFPPEPPFPPAPPTTAVPEPSVWALMILGFGAVGTCLRRRRALTS